MKKFPLAHFAALWALVLVGPASAAPVDLVRMERAIDQRVERGEFMGAVLVARNGQVLFNKAYGVASAAQKIANQPETRFRVGSVTKQITAAGILWLEEHGRLKLTDRISRYMPEAPPDWKDITFQHLLTHTSGIPNLTNLPGYRAIEGTSLTPGQLVDLFRERRLDFAPGTSWNYSNSGYILLGYLIERIAGMPYGRFVRERLLVPLKMWSTGYEPGVGRLAWQAQGHVRGPDGPLAARSIDMSVPFSAGGMYSTSTDLLKWVNGLYGGRLLRPEELHKMLTPFRNHYGLGVVIEELPGGEEVYSIGGGIEGFNARVVYASRSRLTLIVLSNLGGQGADEVAGDLRTVAEGRTLPSDRAVASVSADALQQLEGTYWSEEGTILLVTRKDDHLQLQGAGGTRDLYAYGPRAFFARTEKVDVDFGVDKDRTQTMVVQLPDRSVHAQRIGASAVREIYEMRARKLQAGSATPGSEAALRTLIGQIVAGAPDYSRLGPTAADLTRRELPRLQPLLGRMGPIKHIEFKGVAPVTAVDMYLVTFQHGPVQARIALGPDGRIWSHDMRLGQPGSEPAHELVSSREHAGDSYNR